jgi:hypothetical protein
MGQRWIAGFDIRCPFLLMSPLFAASLFFLITFNFVRGGRVTEGQPKPADVDLIQTAALEFGFGPVDVIRQRYGKELRLAIMTGGADGKESSLPVNWSQLSFDAKRFAIVRALADSNVSPASRVLKALPAHATRLVAMILVGFNLWLILLCQSLAAVRLAYLMFWQRGKQLAYQDVRALTIMRDLKAAIAFVKGDPMNAEMQVKPEQRIAALRKAAVRMGIA